MSSGKKWEPEKRLVSCPKTAHFGRWTNSQHTATRDVPSSNSNLIKLTPEEWEVGFTATPSFTRE